MPVYSAHSGDPCYNSSGLHLLGLHDGLPVAPGLRRRTSTPTRWRTTTRRPPTTTARTTAPRRRVHPRLLPGPHRLRVHRRRRLRQRRRTRSCSAPAPRCVATDLRGAVDLQPQRVRPQYPDVPVDLICASGATCTAYSPSLFSQVRLASITTQQYNVSAGAYENVDSYALNQTEPASGDGLSPTLWLASITRTGDDTTRRRVVVAHLAAAGVVRRRPTCRTGSSPPPSRACTGTASRSITNETGGVTDVSYGTPDPLLLVVLLVVAVRGDVGEHRLVLPGVLDARRATPSPDAGLVRVLCGHPGLDRGHHRRRR